jgi:SAM-dependent methyltransferase
VIDLAAGTGNLAGRLVRMAAPVIAVDIDRRMLAALGQRLPGVARVSARGEQLPFPSGAAGALVISSAWHWLDPERAWPEIARVVRPGGTFSVLWSGPDRSVAWVEDVLGHWGSERLPRGASERPPGGTSERPARPRWQVEVPVAAPFWLAEGRTFTDSTPYAVADLPGLAASYSSVMVLPEAEREGVKAEVAARAAARPELAAGATVDLPIRCRVWRAVRT